MRSLETTLPMVLALWVLWPLVTGARRRPLGHLIVVIAAAIVGVHLATEGYRWQMTPLYAATAIAAILVIWDTVDPPEEVSAPRSRSTLIAALIGVGALALSTFLPWVLPVPEMPEPLGPYAVGTATWELTDSSRPEMYGPDPGGPRRLAVHVWYPSAPQSDPEYAPWTDDIDVVGPALAGQLGFPRFFFDHAGLVDTHAVAGAPMAPDRERYPVVIYSHGWTGAAGLAVNQLESLASHGYVVVAPDHTYGAFVTVFSDGSAVEADQAALPEEEEVEEDVYAAAAERLVEAYAADLGFVLDSLGSVTGQPFSGKLDLDRVGVFGHSTGGGAAAALCAEDARCDAMLGFDPWVEPISDDVISAGLDVPHLFFRSEEWTGYDNDARLRQFFDAANAPGYWMSADGSDHKDFVVSPFFSPVASWIGLKGPISGAQMTAIIDAYLVGFFDEYLGGGSSGILIGPPERFPEVRFEAAP